ncbi:MAG: DJ-1/PfpI family protein [Alphaproteobacteria bacterium]
MSHADLSGLKAVFVVANGFCEREFLQALDVLESMQVTCRIVSVKTDLVRGWNEEKVSMQSNWGKDYAPDSDLSSAQASDYDILVLPGGKRSIEKLELDGNLKPFVSAFIETGKPVVAYNYAVDILMRTNLVDGYSIAARDALCDNAKSVGARCAAPEFVVSKNLITMTRYRDIGDKLVHAVQCVISGEKYMDKVVSSDNMPTAHKAA